MQKRKFSLQNFEGGRALSREEMKLVVGGVLPPIDSCGTTGSACGGTAVCCSGYTCITADYGGKPYNVCVQNPPGVS